MHMSNRGLAQLASEEAMVLGWYKDSRANDTWGVGHTPAAGFPNNPTELANPSQERVVMQFAEDVAKYSEQVRGLLKRKVTQEQFDALVIFQYNTGGLRRAALLRYLNAGNMKKAGDAFMGWSKPKSIIGRRRRTQMLFRTGQYSERPIRVETVANGHRKVSHVLQAWEFTALIAAPKPVGVLPDPIPDMAQMPDTPTHEPSGAYGAKAAAGAAVALVAALGVWWEHIINWVKGVFG